MDHPKCKLCGKPHASWEPHQLGKPEEPKEPKQSVSSAERVKRWRKKHREEYNAKMREYRRKRKEILEQGQKSEKP